LTNQKQIDKVVSKINSTPNEVFAKLAGLARAA
jgi:hypothetical protein